MTKRVARTMGIVCISLALFATAACTQKVSFRKEAVTPAVGAAVGAAVGGGLGVLAGAGTGKIAIGIAGAIAGAFTGYEIGRYLNPTDRMLRSAAAGEAIVSGPGKVTTWKNPGSGANGSATVTKEGKDKSGRDCREFKETVNVKIDGERKSGNGTSIACRNKSGNWEWDSTGTLQDTSESKTEKDKAEK